MAIGPRDPALFVALAVGVTFVTGYAGLGASGGPAQPAAAIAVDRPAPAEGAGPGPPTVDDRDPRRPFQEFWAQADFDGGGALAAELIGQLDSVEPEFLIATVPDPIDSRFGYRFDAILDDIQMAIEGQGWNFDRFWLPWWPAGTQLTQRGQMQPVLGHEPANRRLDLGLGFWGALGGTAGDRGAGPKSALHEREPGVLLFRKARHQDDCDPRQRLLVVFLVGERPTSGVHKVPLGRAFQVVEAVTRRAERSQAKTRGTTKFDILGPYFSGSERSISAAIHHWVDDELARNGPPLLKKDPPDWHFDILSGGATQIDPEQFVSDSRGDRPVKVEFHATVHHFDRVLDTLLKFLYDRNGGWALGKVALLTESDTEFGNKLLAERGGLERSYGASITQMKYPFHISQVAIAIDRFRRGDPKAPPALSRSSSKLRIPFDETGTPRDIVPSLSPQTTAASDEFDIAKILETIAVEGFRYVGIIASDTRDTVFVSGLIQEYCPDVQIFTATGDLLLGHPDYAGQLRGTVVASPYPLFSMAQRWDPPHRGDSRRHLFMHESDQGYYNAAVTFVGRREAARITPCLTVDDKYYNYLYDYGRPFDEMDLAAPDARPAPNHPDDFIPPIWVGVVGERGVWPVKFESSRAGAAGMAEEKEDADASKRGYAFVPSAKEVPDEEERTGKYVDGKLIPLIPQFTWAWGALAIGLGALIWRLSLAQWEVETGTDEPGGFSYRFRFIPDDDGRGRSPLFGSQEVAVASLLVALAAVYGFVVLYPCHLTVRHSPWGHFLGPALLRRPFAWGDLWNWQFGLLMIVLSQACVAAFAATVALRLHHLAGPRIAPPFAALMIAVGLAWGWRAAVAMQVDLVGWSAFVVVPLLFVAAWSRSLLIPLAVSIVAFELGMTMDAASGVAGATAAWAASIRWADALIVTSCIAAVIRLSARADARPGAGTRPAKWVRRLALGVVPLAGGVAMVGVEVAACPPTGPYDSLLFLERAFSLGNGVTPVLPVLLLGAAAGGWCLCQLRRAGMADRFWRDRYAKRGPKTPELGLDGTPGMEAVALRKGRVVDAAQKVRDVLKSPIPGEMWKRSWSAAAMGLAAILLLRMYARSIPTVDGIAFGRAMVVSFAVLTLAIVVSLNRLLLVWLALQKVLRGFALLPMQQAFDRVPAAISREFGPYLNAIRPTLPYLERHARQWARVAANYQEDDVLKALPAGTVPTSAQIKDLNRTILGEDLMKGKNRARPTLAAERILRAFEDECRDPRKTVELSTSDVRRGIRKATAACLSVLIPYWKGRQVGEAYGEMTKGKADGSASKREDPAGKAEDTAGPSPDVPARFEVWVRDAEDLVALELINFVSECTVHLKNLAKFLTFGPLLLLLAATSYPFQPGHYLVNCLWGLLLAVAAGVTWVYVGLERDEVLSRVAKTSPAAINLNWTFLTQITAVLVPLLGSLLARFPLFSDTLNQWLGPIFGGLQ